MNYLVPAIGFGLITASILAIAAVGFTMQFGVTNILNLAYGDLMTASAFIAYICNHAGLNIWACLPIAAVFGAVASVLLNRFLYFPFVRRGTRLFGMVVVTIAVSLIVQNLVLAIGGPNFFSYRLSNGASLHLVGMTFTAAQLAILALSLLCMAGIHLLLSYTKLGRAMRATANNPPLARTCGIDTQRIIDLAWLISGALCGVSGVALVMNLTSFTSTTGGAFLITIVAAAVLGGVGQPYGAMLGALTIGVATEVAAAFIDPSAKDIVAFLILVVVLLLRPQGILSEVATQKEVAA